MASVIVLMIIVIGFATLYSFAVTNVHYAGHDSRSIADARAAADRRLVEPERSDAFHVAQDAEVVWSANNSGKLRTYRVVREEVDIDSVRDDAGSLTIYKRYSDLVRIVYLNGGTGVPYVELSLERGSLHTILDAATAGVEDPPHPSMNFRGWNTRPDGYGVRFSPGETYIIVEHTTFFPDWEYIWHFR